MTNLDLNKKEECYLTAEAFVALHLIREAGITDGDLALAVLEILWPQSQIYCLEDSVL